MFTQFEMIRKSTKWLNGAVSSVQIFCIRYFLQTGQVIDEDMWGRQTLGLFGRYSINLFGTSENSRDKSYFWSRIFISDLNLDSHFLFRNGRNFIKVISMWFFFSEMSFFYFVFKMILYLIKVLSIWSYLYHNLNIKDYIKI